MDSDLQQASQFQNLWNAFAGQQEQVGQTVAVSSGIGTPLTSGYNSAYAGISILSPNYISTGCYNAALNFTTFISPGVEPYKEPKMRVIRYTVVDPDLNLLKTDSSFTLIASDTIVVRGNDNSKFLMDLALILEEDLKDYNASIAPLFWLDDENREHHFKARKFSDLDVIIEVLKTYA